MDAVRMRRIIDDEGAEAVIAAAHEYANEQGYRVVVAVVDPNGELRANSVDGGKPHRLDEGDVLAIPSGVPHQFTDVSDPFLYFVVKVGV